MRGKITPKSSSIFFFVRGPGGSAPQDPLKGPKSKESKNQGDERSTGRTPTLLLRYVGSFPLRTAERVPHGL